MCKEGSFLKERVEAIVQTSDISSYLLTSLTEKCIVNICGNETP